MSRYTLYNKNISLLTAVLLVLMLLLPLAPAASAAELSGTCGEDLSWSFADGTLTITGSGEMTNYTQENFAPWYPFRDKIIRLELPQGLTSVGDLAFYDCSALTAIVLPEKVTRVGDLAFCQCVSATILRLNDGLQTIGDNAFERCISVQSLRIPRTVDQIGSEAFYRCTALQYVTVPERVTNLGSGVFAYCEDLLRAEIQSPIRELPQWTFYGCTGLTSIALTEHTKEVGSYSVYGCMSLSVVYYGGEPGDAEELQAQIAEDRQGFDTLGQVTTEKPEQSEVENSAGKDENGDMIVENTTVSQTENTTISATTGSNVSNPDAPEPPSRVIASVYTEEGWNEVRDTIEELDREQTIEVTVYEVSGTEIPRDVIEDLAGRKVIMTVIGSNGAAYILDFSTIGDTRLDKTLDLSYSLMYLNETDHETLKNVTAYELRFHSSSTIDAQILVRLPAEHARRTATLFSEKGGELVQIQSVVADQQAVAHFFLGAVDEKTVYYIAIDLPDVKTEDTIIPESLEMDFAITEQIQNVDYVITGRKSSWNIGFLELNQIMVGFMLSTASIVGLLMYARNKRKIRQGYIPGWDDAEDDT